MEPFKISLSNNAIVSGLASLPNRNQASGSPTIPLVVGIHGGTYSAEYYFADDHHSALPVSSALGVPFLAINRPGYKDSSPIPSVAEGSSFLQDEGKYLHTSILPAIWKQYASRLGVSSIILMTNSLGAPGAIVAAALNVESKLYPLAGLIISGIGTEWNREHSVGLLAMLEAKPETIGLPDELKDLSMLGTPDEGMADPSIYKQTSVLQTERGFAEYSEILTQ